MLQSPYPGILSSLPYHYPQEDCPLYPQKGKLKVTPISSPFEAISVHLASSKVLDLSYPF